MTFLSLFSGIEAVSVALKPLGWHPVAFAEIEPFPCALLKRHYPNVSNLGDVEKITQADIESLGHINAVIFGFPCQDLSVAGKRAGLKGERSGLFFTAMRIVRWSRARFALFENVPGLFSSEQGRDFAAVVGEMVGMEFDVPEFGWQNTGVALGPDGLLEWAVLDAQWFGVPQRRRRIFAITDFGDWASRQPILLERESMCGNPPTRQQAGQRVAPTISARTKGGGGLGTDFDLDGGLIASTGDVLHCLNAGGMHRIDYETETLVAHSLRAEGFDASEDGTGRGIPLTVGAMSSSAGTDKKHGHGWGQQDWESGYVIPVLEAGARTGKSTDDVRAGMGIGDPGDPMYTLQSGKQHAIAFSCKDHGADAGDLAPTLRSINFDKSHANAGGQVAVVFDRNALPQGYRLQDPSGTCETISCNPAGGMRISPVAASSAVRRLTPEECESLQGFSRGYTKVPYRGKPAADGPRYKALGNSIAVPVMFYIGKRICEAMNGEGH